jgi:hypothetical protein
MFLKEVLHNEGTVLNQNIYTMSNELHMEKPPRGRGEGGGREGGGRGEGGGRERGGRGKGGRYP